MLVVRHKWLAPGGGRIASTDALFEFEFKFEVKKKHSFHLLSAAVSPSVPLFWPFWFDL